MFVFDNNQYQLLILCGLAYQNQKPVLVLLLLKFDIDTYTSYV